MPNYTHPRGQRDPEPTDLAAAKRAVATAAAMTQESRPASRHAELLAALRTRLGLAADATEATIVAASDTDTLAQKQELLDAAVKKDEKPADGIVHAAPNPTGVAFMGMFAPPPVMTEPIKLN